MLPIVTKETIETFDLDLNKGAIDLGVVFDELEGENPDLHAYLKYMDTATSGEDDFSLGTAVRVYALLREQVDIDRLHHQLQPPTDMQDLLARYLELLEEMASLIGKMLAFMPGEFRPVQETEFLRAKKGVERIKRDILEIISD